MRSKKNIIIYILISGVAFLPALFTAPEALAYAQATYYSQGYYQSYYQSYYQTYYQSTYGVTFSTDVVMNSTLYVTGGVSKGSGSFVIDHPLDPANKLLYHSFVESPDVKNIYDGLIVLDTNGEAIVTLPHYFDTLNKDYRYQVKSINEPAPNLHIKKEIEGNQFVIAGGPAKAIVSWQVTGIRQDPYILANPVIPEVEKGPDQLADKGEFLFEGYEDIMSSRNSLWDKISNFFNKIWDKLVDWLVFWD